MSPTRAAVPLPRQRPQGDGHLRALVPGELLRSPAGSWLSVLARAAWTVIECCAGRWSCLVKRVCRSTRVPIPKRWFGPDDQCNGRYCLVVWRFRRRSRRPGQRSAYHNRSVTPAGHVSDPTRSSSDRNRGELGRTGRRSSGGTSLAVPSFGRNVVPFFQICAADRLTPTSMAATRNGTPWAINSTNRCRANDFGRLPRTSGIRRVDNEYLSTRVYVASFAGNQPTAT